MSHFSNVTLFVFPSMPTAKVVDRVHDVWLQHQFHIEYGYSCSWIRLSDIETEDGDDYIFESETIDLETEADVSAALERLRQHPTGGYAEYTAIPWGLEQADYGPYGTLVCFNSLDNKSIEYLSVFIRTEVYEQFQAVYDAVFKDIGFQLNPIATLNYMDYDLDDLSEEEIARTIKAGKISDFQQRKIRIL